MKTFVPEYLPFNHSHWDWERLINKISSASASLAYYNGILRSMINPAIFLTPLETKEAILSSRIEGTVTTLDEVLKYEADLVPENESKRKDIIEVLNYRVATRHAHNWLKRDLLFGQAMVCAIQKELMAGVRGRDKKPGEIRKELVWIGPPNCKIEDATYVPPEPLSINSYLENLFKYLLTDGMEPLIQTAIMHAQFEIIHPFMDGNGRTGRILIPLFLWYKKRVYLPMFYISEYFDQFRDNYVSKLQDISKKGAWEEWITFFLDAIEVQAQRNAEKANQVLSLYSTMKGIVSSVSNSPYGIKVLDTLFKMPVFKSTDFGEVSGLNPQTTHRILTRFKEEKILVTLRKPSGRSPEILRFERLYRLINR